MSGEQIPDQELVQRSVAGDSAAFEGIVERYQGVVCATAYNGTGDFHASEDLAQETFLRAWRKLAQLREPHKLCAWLCGIARNLAQDHLRGRKFEKFTAPADDLPLADPGTNPAEQAISREQERLLWSCLAELPENYREPLILFYREQQSINAVAFALELSEEAVKQRLHRGRGMLREKMAAFVEESLVRSAPDKKAFTAAVMTALAVLAPQAATAATAVAAAKTLGAAKGSAGLLAVFTVAIGPILGILGGVLGGIASYKTARSDPERRFALRFSLGILLGVLIFMAGILLIGANMIKLSLINALVAMGGWIGGYMFLIFYTSIWANRKITRIRRETGTERVAEPLAPLGANYSEKEFRWMVLGSSFGLIVGSLTWIYTMSLHAGEAGLAWFTLTFGVLLYAAIAFLSRRRPQASFKIMGVCAGLIALFETWFLIFVFGEWMPRLYPGLARIGAQSQLHAALCLTILPTLFFISAVLFFKGRRIIERWEQRQTDPASNAAWRARRK